MTEENVCLKELKVQDNGSVRLLMLLEFLNLPGKTRQPGDDAPRGRRLGDKKYVPRKTVDFVK